MSESGTDEKVKKLVEKNKKLLEIIGVMKKKYTEQKELITSYEKAPKNNNQDNSKLNDTISSLNSEIIVLTKEKNRLSEMVNSLTEKIKLIDRSSEGQSASNVSIDELQKKYNDCLNENRVLQNKYASEQIDCNNIITQYRKQIDEIMQHNETLTNTNVELLGILLQINKLTNITD